MFNVMFKHAYYILFFSEFWPKNGKTMRHVLSYKNTIQYNKQLYCAEYLTKLSLRGALQV